jgi:hypothetical protein
MRTNTGRLFSDERPGRPITNSTLFERFAPFALVLARNRSKIYPELIFTLIHTMPFLTLAPREQGKRG